MNKLPSFPSFQFPGTIFNLLVDPSGKKQEFKICIENLSDAKQYWVSRFVLGARVFDPEQKTGREIKEYIADWTGKTFRGFIILDDRGNVLFGVQGAALDDQIRERIEKVRALITANSQK